jgi:hypothetical protein
MTNLDISAFLSAVGDWSSKHYGQNKMTDSDKTLRVSLRKILP